MSRSAIVVVSAVSWLAAAGVLGGATAAAETVPPAQAVADNGVFLEHAPPPPQPAAVCIVDSGVDLNPDTASQVVFREALDGGDPGDVSPDKHGTLMAMMAAAPVNGWGMVGAAPGAVKIVSVRVEEAGEGTVPFSAYEQGITACQKQAAAYDIRAVSLSLVGTLSPQGNDEAMLENAVDSAQRYGINVLAAAGNDGGPVRSPASYAPVIAVAAADSTGALCQFSNRGAAHEVSAPGCGLDGVDPVDGTVSAGQQGTSEATAIAAAVLVDMRAYRPDLSAENAAQLLEGGSGNRLNVTALFANAGLTGLIPPVRSPARLPADGHGLPAPKVRVLRLGPDVLVEVLNLPHATRVQATLLREKRVEFRTRLTVLAKTLTSHSVLRLRVGHAVSSVSFRFLGSRGRSPVTTIRINQNRS
jgi:hypothetical protein